MTAKRSAVRLAVARITVYRNLGTSPSGMDGGWSARADFPHGDGRCPHIALSCYPSGGSLAWCFDQIEASLTNTGFQAYLHETRRGGERKVPAWGEVLRGARARLEHDARRVARRTVATVVHRLLWEK